MPCKSLTRACWTPDREAVRRLSTWDRDRCQSGRDQTGCDGDRGSVRAPVQPIRGPRSSVPPFAGRGRLVASPPADGRGPTGGTVPGVAGPAEHLPSRRPGSAGTPIGPGRSGHIGARVASDALSSLRRARPPVGPRRASVDRPLLPGTSDPSNGCRGPMTDRRDRPRVRRARRAVDSPVGPRRRRVDRRPDDLGSDSSPVEETFLRPVRAVV